MKKIFTTFAAVMLMCAPVFAQQGVSVQIDGKMLETDVPAQITEGRTMVPMRAIFEALGTEITWDADTKTVTATQGDASVVMQVGNKEFTVMGAKNTLDVPPMIVDGRTLVPVRAVSESFECEVNWSAEEKLVSIITSDYKPAPAAEENTENTDNTENTEEYIFAQTPKAELSSGDYAPPAINDSKMDEVQLTLHQDARYAFEQQFLRDELFGDAKYAQLIKNSPEEFANSVGEIWNYAAANTLVEYMMAASQKYVIESEDDIYKYIYDLQKECCLTVEENIGGNYWSKNGETYLLLEMAEDNYLTSCRYIMISYTEVEGFRIRTMEKSLNDMDAFCEIEKSSRHTDYVAESTDKKADFLNYIFGE